MGPERYEAIRLGALRPERVDYVDLITQFGLTQYIDSRV